MGLSIAIIAHVLSAIVWVGGMFFAYVILRPCAGQVLESSNRLLLWAAIFKQFFRWVWLAVILLISTGYWMVFGVFGGMQNVGIHVHIMHGLAWLMILLFFYLNFGPVRHLQESVENADWSNAGTCLSKIRGVVGVNLCLGLITSATAASGGF